MSNKKVGSYNKEFNFILGKDYKELDIFLSDGLKTHLLKRHHYKALAFIDRISEIIISPDYIGINPNESIESFELVKKFDENILVGIKLESNGKNYYVSTMYDIPDSKIQRFLYNGRLHEFIDINKNID